jgi:hypothetical protein
LNTYKVVLHRNPQEDTVEASTFEVTPNGDVVFYKNTPSKAFIVKVFAKGVWYEVSLIEQVDD